jgi:hypothetical protein
MHYFAGRGLKCSDPILSEMSQSPRTRKLERKSRRSRSGVALNLKTQLSCSREPLHGFEGAGLLTPDDKRRGAIKQGTRPVVRRGSPSELRRPAAPWHKQSLGDRRTPGPGARRAVPRTPGPRPLLGSSQGGHLLLSRSSYIPLSTPLRKAAAPQREERPRGPTHRRRSRESFSWTHRARGPRSGARDPPNLKRPRFRLSEPTSVGPDCYHQQTQVPL